MTRSYKWISTEIGADIFGKNHKPHPYYTAAFALYRLEYLFRSHRIDPTLKAARYQMLYALRLLTGGKDVPPKNSYAMESYCDQINSVLWDIDIIDGAFSGATAAVLSAVPTGPVDGDFIRTVGFTERVARACEHLSSGTET